MTKNEAYEFLCEALNDEPFVVACRECPKFYGFFIAAGDTQEGQPVFVNNQMLCVDKETGDVLSEEDNETYIRREEWTPITFSNNLEHSDISDDEDDKHRYGIPSLKKFPMPDKRHVKSAIRFFNYVDPKHEKELATAILSRIEEFGMVLGEDITVGDDNRFKKYLPEEKES